MRHLNAKNAADQAARICHNKQLRFTDLRRRVLTMIWKDRHPAKAYDILERLRIEVPNAKPPTVYRALDFLLENRFIHRLDSLNAYIGCPHPLASHECYFLICKICGTVKECCGGAIAETIRQTADNYQFNPKRTTLEIVGVCGKCGDKNFAENLHPRK